MTMSPAFLALSAARDALEAEYVSQNPNSAAAFEEARASGVAGGTNRASIHYSPFPLTFVNAAEARAETADGQWVTDLLGNFTAGLFGFSPEPVRRAVSNAMANGHTLGGAANRHEAVVARELTSRFAAMEQIRFTMTGTEANSYAINTALAVTGRSKIMVYDGAYHGAWIHGGKLAGPLDTPYEKITVPYGDADAIAATIRRHADELAAVILEPVMVNPTTYLKRLAPKAYLQRIRAACTEAGCALIYDEVMTSRLAPGGAQQLVDVAPDMTTIGKYFGGGLPFGAFGGTRAWMERHDPAHPRTINSGGTFNQNALSMAAAAAVLNDLWTPEHCAAHNRRGDHFRDAINELAAQHGAPVQACGSGSLITLIWQRAAVVGAITDDTVAHDLNIANHPGTPQAAAAFWFYMLTRHSLLAGSPRLNYLTLPTVLEDADYKTFLSALSDFLNEYREPLALLSAETSETAAA
ncbi:MAG: aminotransferase class III-fold pyridoxal phosphate-dependent enzyme [Pseudomonadota bacterium]